MLRVRGKGFVCGYIYYPFAFSFYLLSPCQGKTHVTVWLNRVSDKNRKLLRWSITLQEYEMEVEHRSGRISRI